MTEPKYTNWKKSSRSGSGGDNCVEIAIAADGTVGVRDSKDTDGAVLEFSPHGWTEFTEAIRSGDFDR